MNDTLKRLTITQSELFRDWPDEVIARLVFHAAVKSVEPGTCVHKAGEPAEFVTLLATGSMTLLKEMADDRVFTSGMHLAGDFHGLGPVLAKAPHMFTAVCKERTVLVKIPGTLLREIIAQNGRLSFSLFAALEKRHLRAQIRHASAAVESMQARIARLLKSIDSRGVQSRTDFEINLSQDEIATMLGTRRQVVNRALKEMAATGVLEVRYGRISIIDGAILDQMTKDPS